jgi:type II secretory pathway pseudopilin PulG
MSVFLRWGVFGILAVAALIYAYNASKRLAENRSTQSAAAATAPAASEAVADETEPEEPAAAPGSGAADGAPAHCETELLVAERALQARRENEPLDRLLRTRLIAFESDTTRRQRLEKVATDWYRHEGGEPVPEALRIYVISSCQQFSPAP